MRSLSLAVLLVVFSPACGGNPVSYSGPVDITLPAVQSKSTAPGGALSAVKDISTAGSNPFGAFVSAAVQHLGGKDPSRVEITSSALAMATTPTGLTFDQIFAGAVAVSFVMNGSGNSYPVSSVASPTGAGPVSRAGVFDSRSMSPADYSAFLQGQFKVVLTGTATSGATGFNSTNSTTSRQRSTPPSTSSRTSRAGPGTAST